MSCYHRYFRSSYGNRMQILANHVIRANQQSGSCAVESPQSRDSPTMMLYYVHQTLFFPRPHTKERKGPGYARLTDRCITRPTAIHVIHVTHNSIIHSPCRQLVEKLLSVITWTTQLPRLIISDNNTSVTVTAILVAFYMEAPGA